MDRNLRESVIRILEQPNDIEKALSASDFTGTGKDVDAVIREWGRENRVETDLVPGFTKHPNRVWISAIPEEVKMRFKEDLEDALMERTESQEDFLLAIYETEDAAIMFRRSAVDQMEQTVISEVTVECPFECDLWLKLDDPSMEEAPNIPSISKAGNR